MKEIWFLLDAMHRIPYYSPMPTLLIKDGFKFFFYANEHLPMHIHVLKGNGYANINLTTFAVTENYFKASELKRALEITTMHQSEFMGKWYEFFSQG